MEEPRDVTAYKRHHASGIVELSRIKPHPDLDGYHLFPQFKKAQEELEGQFRRETCKPWLKESRLKVEVSQSQWDDKIEIIGYEKLGEDKFPILRFKKDLPFYIQEDVALLELARSSKSRGLAQSFKALTLKERWWVVDFFLDGKDLLITIDGAGGKSHSRKWSSAILHSYFANRRSSRRLP
jgi:hypothetical protein